MTFGKKFNRVAGAGILCVTATALSGCGEPPGAEVNGTATVIAANCIVIDRDAGPAFRWSYYDFNRDFAQFSLNVRGVPVMGDVTQVFQGEYSVKISELPAGDGQVRALAMYDKLPPALKCPKPVFGK